MSKYGQGMSSCCWQLVPLDLQNSMTKFMSVIWIVTWSEWQAPSVATLAQAFSNLPIMAQGHLKVIIARYERRLLDAHAEAMAASDHSRNHVLDDCEKTSTTGTQTSPRFSQAHVGTQTSVTELPIESGAPAPTSVAPRVQGVPSSQSGVLDLIVKQAVAEYTPARRAETVAKQATELVRNMAKDWP